MRSVKAVCTYCNGVGEIAANVLADDICPVCKGSGFTGAAASLPESQPAPEMDYEDECPAWEVALNDMRVRFPKGNELELLASEYLRLREAELAHDARVQPSSVAGTEIKPIEEWIEWVEPFGPNDEPVYMRVTKAVAIAKMKQAHPELNDERALHNFVVVNWALVSQPNKMLNTIEEIGKLAKYKSEAKWHDDAWKDYESKLTEIAELAESALKESSR